MAGLRQAFVALAKPPWLQAIDQTRVADRTALMKGLDAVMRAGGEGLMLHRLGGAPSHRPQRRAAEAETPAGGRGHCGRPYAGQGKIQGMTGAMQIEMPDGKRFRLGSGLS